MVGVVHDWTGSYEVPMMVAAGFMLAAGLCILMAPRTVRQVAMSVAE
jgi:cyanate permease